MKKLLTVLTLIFLGFSIGFAQQRVSKKSLDTAVKTIFEESDLPVILPTYFPYQPFSTAKDKRKILYARVVVDGAGYELDFCFSSRTCLGAYFYAEISVTRLPSIPDEPSGKKVRLAQGYTGYYEKSACGANCAPGNLTWDYIGNRYTVSLNANVKTLVKFANSIINNVPVDEEAIQTETVSAKTVSLEEFLKSAMKTGDNLVIEAKGDLNADGLADWAGIIHRKKDPPFVEKKPFDEKPWETDRTEQIYVLFGQKQGDYLIEEKSKETGIWGIGNVYIENLEIKRSNLYLQINSGSISYIIYQFRKYRGEWRLVGVKETQNLSPPDEDVIRIYTKDRNLLTGTVIETREAGSRKTKVKIFKKKYPSFLLKDFDLYGWDDSE